jgi:hypothetical protein
MQRPQHVPCPDCGSGLSRREFVKTVGVAALTAGAAPLVFPLPGAFAAPTPTSPAETAVQRLYASLSATQRETICLPFDHAARTKINANWAVTSPKIVEDFYTKEQQQMIAEIFRGITSEDGHARFLKQMEEDDGGFDQYHVAIFGEPGSGKFEFELTGRHMTIRADGDSVAGAAFGGPIVYGHGEESPADNLFHYQTKQANEVFKALDAKQAELALLENAPAENAVQLQGNGGKFPGIAVATLSADQKSLVEKVIKDLLAPYRKEDVDEAMALLKAGGGLDSLRMAFYKQNDLQNDKVWDIWRVEGPTFVSHFRGAPHVHAYLNVGVRQG